MRKQEEFVIFSKKIEPVSLNTDLSTSTKEVIKIIQERTGKEVWGALPWEEKEGRMIWHGFLFPKKIGEVKASSLEEAKKRAAMKYKVSSKDIVVVAKKLLNLS